MDKTIYPAILEHISDGVICVTEGGKVLFLNRSGEKLLGKKREEIIHHPYSKHFNNDSFAHLELTVLPTSEGKVLLFRKKALEKEIIHDIRNPLSGIRGFAELLLRDLKDQPKQARMAENIIRGADELNNVLRENA